MRKLLSVGLGVAVLLVLTTVTTFAQWPVYTTGTDVPVVEGNFELNQWAAQGARMGPGAFSTIPEGSSVVINAAGETATSSNVTWTAPNGSVGTGDLQNVFVGTVMQPNAPGITVIPMSVDGLQNDIAVMQAGRGSIYDQAAVDAYNAAVPSHRRQGMFNEGGVSYADFYTQNYVADTAPPPGETNVPGFGQ